jgi:hypothetical protein
MQEKILWIPANDLEFLDDFALIPYRETNLFCGIEGVKRLLILRIPDYDGSSLNTVAYFDVSLLANLRRLTAYVSSSYNMKCINLSLEHDIMPNSVLSSTDRY